MNEIVHGVFKCMHSEAFAGILNSDLFSSLMNHKTTSTLSDLPGCIVLMYIPTVYQGGI